VIKLKRRKRVGWPKKGYVDRDDISEGMNVECAETLASGPWGDSFRRHPNVRIRGVDGGNTRERCGWQNELENPPLLKQGNAEEERLKTGKGTTH